MVFAIINIVAFVIAFVGCLNWGLIAIFDWNLVTAVFGNGRAVGTIIVYVLVLLSALWLLFAIFYQRGKIGFAPNRQHDDSFLEN